VGKKRKGTVFWEDDGRFYIKDVSMLIDLREGTSEDTIQ
jgi:hypothetical protein